MNDRLISRAGSKVAELHIRVNPVMLQGLAVTGFTTNVGTHTPDTQFYISKVIELIH